MLWYPQATDVRACRMLELGAAIRLLQLGSKPSLVLLGAVVAGTQNNVFIAHDRQACVMENTPNTRLAVPATPHDICSVLLFYH